MFFFFVHWTDIHIVVIYSTFHILKENKTKILNLNYTPIILSTWSDPHPNFLFIWHLRLCTSAKEPKNSVQVTNYPLLYNVLNHTYWMVFMTFLCVHPISSLSLSSRMLNTVVITSILISTGWWCLSGKKSEGKRDVLQYHLWSGSAGGVMTAIILLSAWEGGKNKETIDSFKHC